MESNIVSIINELCKRNYMTVGQLERELKFSQGLISRWDKNSPSVDKIIAVSDYFKTSVDFILGRSSANYKASIEDVFIDKIIQETESYLVQWVKYSEKYIPLNPLRDNFITAYNNKWKISDTLENEKIKFELPYYSSCLYMIEAIYNKKSNYFLIMQLDINSQNYDNFVPISNLNNFDKMDRLFSAIILCINNFELTNKSRAVIQSYIGSNNTQEDDYISRKYIVNNFLTTLPGFVLDGRAGTTLWNKISNLEDQIKKLQKKS